MSALSSSWPGKSNVPKRPQAASSSFLTVITTNIHSPIISPLADEHGTYFTGEIKARTSSASPSPPPQMSRCQSNSAYCLLSSLGVRSTGWRLSSPSFSLPLGPSLCFIFNLSFVYRLHHMNCAQVFLILKPNKTRKKLTISSNYHHISHFLFIAKFLEKSNICSLSPLHYLTSISTHLNLASTCPTPPKRRSKLSPSLVWQRLLVTQFNILSSLFPYPDVIRIINEPGERPHSPDPLSAGDDSWVKAKLTRWGFQESSLKRANQARRHTSSPYPFLTPPFSFLPWMWQSFISHLLTMGNLEDGN